ncbi:MAG: tRNA 5-methoxyuridine(34)/uridine 5-oxyacetic acid(34) synthase CmoB [Gammaproteobacteria bacterium]|nr:tRNA 5-methoxyuridine(34)/uridine 5-oxyacetic acid(34) synthase CmoB [Gammaproteobacteria bacterium]
MSARQKNFIHANTCKQIAGPNKPSSRCANPVELLDYQPCIELLQQHELPELAAALPAMLARGLDATRYGDMPRWQAALNALPELSISDCDMGASAVRAGCIQDQCGQGVALEQALRALHPWRKGPFEIAGVPVNTEWRSDFKWQRLCDAIDSLAGQRVLDVGCGNGYHCWRMRAAQAGLVVGIDPTPLFIMQYWALQKYLQDPAVWVLPARSEDLPRLRRGFDTVFSMGVLYHRRSPFDHLLELREALAPGGQLVLETLVIEGSANPTGGEVLVPEGRYSKMGNVWFIPSVATLCSWLRKMKFREPTVIDVSVTSPAEQRATEWMTFQSLADFLDPDDSSKTVEGYPAPRRAIVSARI